MPGWSKAPFAVAVMAVGFVCVGPSCSDPVTRPPALADCSDPSCTSLGVSLGTFANQSGTGSSSTASGGGAAGSSSLPGTEVTLSGDIQVISEPDLVGDRPLLVPLTVRAPGSSSAFVSVASANDGTFSLTGVSPSSSLWVAVGTFDGSSSGTYVDTLQPVDTSLSAPTLRVLRRSVLEQIVQDAFLIAPVQLDSTAATLIVTFLDTQGKAIPGVSLIQPDPASSSVAYDTGQSYSDQTGQTSLRGTLVLANVPSSKDPDSVISLVALGNDGRFDLDVHTVAGGATIATVRQSP